MSGEWSELHGRADAKLEDAAALGSGNFLKGSGSDSSTILLKSRNTTTPLHFASISLCNRILSQGTSLNSVCLFLPFQIPFLNSFQGACLLFDPDLTWLRVCLHERASSHVKGGVVPVRFCHMQLRCYRQQALFGFTETRHLAKVCLFFSLSHLNIDTDLNHKDELEDQLLLNHHIGI